METCDRAARQHLLLQHQSAVPRSAARQPQLLQNSFRGSPKLDLSLIVVDRRIPRIGRHQSTTFRDHGVMEFSQRRRPKGLGVSSAPFASGAGGAVDPDASPSTAG